MYNHRPDGARLVCKCGRCDWLTETFMHVSEGQLYAATVADFSGGEPLIHREKIRTERSDLNQLNGKLLRIRKSKYGVSAMVFRNFVNLYSTFCANNLCDFRFFNSKIVRYLNNFNIRVFTYIFFCCYKINLKLKCNFV